MSTENLKGAALTNLDATPVVVSTTGEGSPGHLRSVSGGPVTGTTGYLATSTYALARMPSNGKLKHAFVGVDGTVSTFTGDIGFYYSTSTVDGTSPANQGTVVANGGDPNQLGDAVDLKTAGFVDYISAFTGAKRNQPLWQALGLASDPGGYMDLVVTITSTNSGAPVVTGELQFVE